MPLQSSGLEFIPNQPVIFDLDVDPCLSFLDSGYCQIFEDDDDVYLQIKALPCGSNLACFDDEPTYGPNVITNGTFNTDIAGWTLTGTGLAWDGVGAMEKSATIFAATFSQSIAIDPGTYRLRVGFPTITNGQFQVLVNGNPYDTLSVAGNTDVVVYNSVNPCVVTVACNAASIGLVDDIIMERVISCYDGPGWSYDAESNSYTHIVGSVDPLEAINDIFLANKSYQVKIRIQNTTAGSVDVVMGINSTGALSSNGSYTRLIQTGTGTGFAIHPSIDFDGIVTIEEIYILTEIGTLMLVDMNGTDIADLTPFFSVSEDRINVHFEFNFLDDLDPDTDELIPMGCYRIKVQGNCAPLEDPLYSNCLKFGESFPCTKWVEAYADCFAHGFDFRGDFKLAMRVPILKWGPGYPIKETSYLYGDGVNSRVSSEKDKIYQAKTDRIDEIAHDALSSALLCSTFTLDGTEYFFKGNSYATGWAKNARQSVTRATFQLAKVESVTYATNCTDCASANPPAACPEVCGTAIGFAADADAEGWYMNEDLNQLQEFDGDDFTGEIISCSNNSYVIAHLSGYRGPFKWNEVNEEWLPIMDGEAPTEDAGVITYAATTLFTACAARIQISVDGGANWTNATIWHSTTELAAGIEFDHPGVSFHFRVELKCGSCYFYSDAFDDFYILNFYWAQVPNVGAHSGVAGSYGSFGTGSFGDAAALATSLQLIIPSSGASLDVGDANYTFWVALPAAPTGWTWDGNPISFTDAGVTTAKCYDTGAIGFADTSLWVLFRIVSLFQSHEVQGASPVYNDPGFAAFWAAYATQLGGIGSIGTSTVDGTSVQLQVQNTHFPFAFVQSFNGITQTDAFPEVSC